MPDIHIYLDVDTYSIYQQIDSGSRSKIIREAIRESMATTDSLDKVQKKLDIEKQTFAESKARIEFLQLRESELLKQKQEKDSILIKEQQSDFDDIVELAVKYYEVTKEIAESWATEYVGLECKPKLSKYIGDKAKEEKIAYKKRK